MDDLIADVTALEEWHRLPAAEQQLTDKLRGVLAETACTGVIRYQWPLLRPLLAQLMQQQLKDFEQAEHVEVGPGRPLLSSGDESASAVAERFSAMLGSFTEAPWTLQRLCELLLEPHKQYRRLHKLVLALEKLLLVNGEVAVTVKPGPLPRLCQLSPVNEVPAAPAGTGGSRAAAAGANSSSSSSSGTAGQKRPRQEDVAAGGLVAAALDIRRVPPQQAAAAAEDKGGAAAAGPHGSSPTGHGAANAEAAVAPSGQGTPHLCPAETVAHKGGDNAAAAAAAGASPAGPAASPEPMDTTGDAFDAARDVSAGAIGQSGTSGIAAAASSEADAVARMDVVGEDQMQP